MLLSHVRTYTHTHTVEQGNVHMTGRTQQSCTSYCPFLYSRLKHTQRSTAFSHCSRAAHPMPATELPGCVWCPEMEPNAQLLPQQWEPQGRNLTLISFQRGFSIQQPQYNLKEERKKEKKRMCLYTISHAAAARQRYAVLQHQLRSTKTTGVDGHSDVS